MNIYLSGPMTGIPDHNFPAFEDATAALRAQGHTVHNPGEKGVIEGHSWEDYLTDDIPEVISADAIALLPGYYHSRGAMLELHIARKLKKNVFHVRENELFNEVIVGIAGFAGAGKDSFAEGLSAVGFQRFSFADPLRDFAAAVNPIISFNTGNPEYVAVYPEDISSYRYTDALTDVGYRRAKEMYPEFRGFLQRLGTEAGREILGENVWRDKLFDTVDRHFSAGFGPPLAAIPDMRFPNELDGIKERGGHTVLIDRPGVVRTSDHPSEAMPETLIPDYFISNDGTLEALHEAAEAFANHITG